MATIPEVVHDWIVVKIVDFLYEKICKRIDTKRKRRQADSNWLNLARRIARRYED